MDEDGAFSFLLVSSPMPDRGQRFARDLAGCDSFLPFSDDVNLSHNGQSTWLS